MVRLCEQGHGLQISAKQQNMHPGEQMNTQLECVEWLIYQLKSEEIGIRINKQDLQQTQAADSSYIITLASIPSILLIRMQIIFKYLLS